MTMRAVLLSSAVVLLVVSLFITSSTSFVLALVGPLTLVPIIFTALFLLLHVTELMSKEKRPPIAGLLLLLLLHFNRIYDYQTSLAKKLRTFRLIMPFRSEVFTADPANIEYILKTNFPNYGKGSHNYKVLEDLVGDGIVAVDGEKWRHQRKLASYEFSTRNLRVYSSAVFRGSAAKLVSQVTIMAAAEQAMDLQDMLMKSTLDSMFKVGFGVELNTLSGSDVFWNRFTKALDDAAAIVLRRYVDPLWRVKRFLNIGLEAALKRNIKIIDDAIFELIRCKREQMKSENLVREKEDLLSRFMMESEKDPINMTDKYLRDFIFSFMLAGKDTSSNTLTWFFYMLCKHPLVQDKVVNEVIEATQAKDKYICPDEFSSLMTEGALEKMQFLHAAITETLRLYPAVGSDSKMTVEDDILPDGYLVKKGDPVSYMPYAMGRMTYIWGEDAEEYRPERWLENGIFRPESPFKFTAFQGGPRICIGKEFAYRQMKILAAFLLYFFQFRLVDETKEATYKIAFSLHLAEGLKVYALPRAG
ncbi:Cytochrome P450 [Corchorus olitorius]|uniref:Cytochrome P450 n=1 Tax=Corchorus olitorius TaxID=93759 RepID=A0A1R3J7S8_9ROSI|nr:Cytochrome P450 [Corchorus olitorius]